MSSWILLVIWGSLGARPAAADLLTPTTDGRGRRQIQMLYAYDTLHRWTLKLTPDVPEVEVDRAIRGRTRWRLVDHQTRVTYQDWTVITRGEGDDHAALVFRIADVRAVQTLLPRLAQATLELDGTPSAALSLSKICTEFAPEVIDLTNPFEPACVVKSTALPKVDQTCLTELARAALEVRRGLVTCNHANDKMFRLGCSYLSCP